MSILTARWYDLRGNICYYYENENDRKPKGVFFLGGCYVTATGIESGGLVAAAAGEVGDDGTGAEANPGAGETPAATQAGGETTQAAAEYGIEITNETSKTSGDASKGERLEQVRTLWATTAEERDEWLASFQDASHVVPIERHYEVRWDECIGSGRLSRVYRGRKLNTGMEGEVAIKVINKANLGAGGRDRAAEEELVRQEIAILKILKHKQCVRLFKMYEAKDNIHLVMELMRGGDLERVLRLRVGICLHLCMPARWSTSQTTEMSVPTHKPLPQSKEKTDSTGQEDDTPRYRKVSERLARSVLEQVGAGLAYLHSINIVHRDIKSENVLMDKARKIFKLADFGLSRMVMPHELVTGACGTVVYVAPEVLKMASSHPKGIGVADRSDLSSGGVSGKAADIWS